MAHYHALPRTTTHYTTLYRIIAHYNTPYHTRQDAECRATLLSEGAVGPLVALVQKPLDASVLAAAADVLGHLALDESGRPLLLRDGVVPPLVQVSASRCVVLVRCRCRCRCEVRGVATLWFGAGASEGG